MVHTRKVTEAVKILYCFSYFVSAEHLKAGCIAFNAACNEQALSP